MINAKAKNTNQLLKLITKKTDLHLKNIEKWLNNLPIQELEKFANIQYRINKSNMKSDEEYKQWVIVGIFDHLFFHKVRSEEIQNDEMWENVENKDLLIKLELKKPEETHHLFEKIAYINKVLEFIHQKTEKKFIFSKINLEANPIY